MCPYIFIIHTQLFCFKQQISIQICKLGNAVNAYEMSMNTNKEMLAGNVDVDASYHAADPDGTRLITDYAATDTDLCIRIMSLCC